MIEVYNNLKLEDDLIEQMRNFEIEKNECTYKFKLKWMNKNGNIGDEATIGHYLQLKEMLESINSSKCTHLLSYLISLIEIYHEKLKNILAL